MEFASCPESLKAIAHYLKVADEHNNRDIVISYWCRLHALEIGMKISVEKSPEITKFLVSLMDWLEKTKTENPNNEGITSKVCAQATVENYALKLFKYADEQDAAENYGKNVVKAFYTAGILMDVLTSFGDLSEDIIEKRKYAKWKAAYIHNCLKAGEKPVPGPIDNSEDNDDDFAPIPKNPGFVNPGINNFPNPPGHSTPAWNTFPTTPENPTPFMPPPQISPTTPSIPEPAPAPAFTPTPPAPATVYPSSSTGSANLNPDLIAKAQKYCKWASSALNYDDVKSAIDNLQKALYLLQTGTESLE